MLDERIKACMNEDGRQGNTPYWLFAGRHIHGVFVLVDWFDPGFNDEDFAAMHTTKKDYVKSKVKAIGPALEAYNSVDGGSYHLTLLELQMSHMAFSDLEWLIATSDADRTRSAQYLATIRQIVREFFDQTLKAVPSDALNCGYDKPGVLVQCYPPIQTRNSK